MKTRGDSLTRHPQLLDRSRALLLVVDIQDPFLRTICEQERVVENSLKLVEVAKILELPILVTVQNQERMGLSTEAITSALPADTPQLNKMTFSCARAEGFGEMLAASNRDQVLMCGVETHVCIGQTAHDLLAQGYQMHIAKDAISSRTRENWKTGIERMRSAGCVITSTEAAIFELIVDARTPEFKRILPLVK